MKTGIKMLVTHEQSRKVQEIVFSYGGKWADGSDQVIMTNFPILSINQEGHMSAHTEHRWPIVAGIEVDANVFISTQGTFKLVITESAQCQAERGAGLKYDTGKLRYSLVPPEALRGIAEVLTFGAEKDEPNSWQDVENAEERYLDALIQHIEAYRSGEALDPESGLHHLKHAACNVAFLIYFEETSARITD